MWMINASGWLLKRMPNVQQKTPDDRQIGCPKHVEFYDNKCG